MRKRVDAISRKQHFTRSRLPTFSSEEIEIIKGSADFLGLNHYTTYLISKNKGKISHIPSFEVDMGGIITQKAEWPKSNSSWIRVSWVLYDFFFDIALEIQSTVVPPFILQYFGIG